PEEAERSTLLAQPAILGDTQQTPQHTGHLNAGTRADGLPIQTPVKKFGGERFDPAPRTCLNQFRDQARVRLQHPAVGGPDLIDSSPTGKRVTRNTQRPVRGPNAARLFSFAAVHQRAGSVTPLSSCLGQFPKLPEPLRIANAPSLVDLTG